MSVMTERMLFVVEKLELGFKESEQHIFKECLEVLVGKESAEFYIKNRKNFFEPITLDEVFKMDFSNPNDDTLKKIEKYKLINCDLFEQVFYEIKKTRVVVSKNPELRNKVIQFLDLMPIEKSFVVFKSIYSCGDFTFDIWDNVSLKEKIMRYGEFMRDKHAELVKELNGVKHTKTNETKGEFMSVRSAALAKIIAQEEQERKEREESKEKEK